MRVALKKARLKKGLKVPEIAKLSDVSASFYYKIERGTRDPIMKKAQTIADILDGTVDELFFNRRLDATSKRTKTSRKNAS